MSKNKARCPCGHYYNADKYEDCPVCNPSLLKAAANHIVEYTDRVNTAASQPHTDYQAFYTPRSAVAGHAGTDVPTEAVFESKTASNNAPDEEGSREHATQQANEVQSGQNQTTYSTESGSSQRPSTKNETPASLLEEIDAVASYRVSADAKTIAEFHAPSGAEPVVGWIVCVKGQYLGQSFNLKTGNNTIGRALDMDVALAQEPGVSRNKHCVITFEPKNQVFFIQQGESGGLTYLNNTLVMSPAAVKAHDLISVGGADFIFIPLCIDGFRWEGYLS